MKKELSLKKSEDIVLFMLHAMVVIMIP